LPARASEGRPRPIGKRDEAEKQHPERAGRLEAGESILLHCSAGIHRTGMVAFALLRWRGASPEEALGLIEALCPETRTGLREVRLAWGNRVARETGR
jgi:protein-tyrosine phosphatase